MDDYVLKYKKRKLELLQYQEKMQEELPHLYGWPWYPWAWEFFNNTTDKVQLLVAANQISKSTTQIRKQAHWATDQELWDTLWGRKPNMFWYLYPSKDVATAEFEKKWVPEVMPRGSMKDDDIYGWEVVYEKKHVKQINWASGVSTYFKTYMQDAHTLQSGSVYSIFCDEELPENLYDELQFRTEGTDGYFHKVFTATLGQQLWWRAMEAKGTDQEFLPSAWKRTVSMYDCLKYVDGSPTPWTEERIERVIAKCKNKAEVNRRVFGRFVKDEGRQVHQFDPTRHFVKPFEIPSHWPRFLGVDIGSGGDNNHPAAISCIACDPDYKKGYVYKAWRGDGIETTSGDVYEKYKEIKGPLEHFVRKVYDHAAKDFGTTATRMGESFEKAEKSHEKGYDLLNTLLKYDMLMLFNTEEVRKLGSEWVGLQKSTPKEKAKDDLSDATRYPIVEVPWNFEDIVEKNTTKVVEKKPKLPQTEKEWQEYHIEQRRARFEPEKQEDPQDWGDLENDIAEWNEMYGN